MLKWLPDPLLAEDGDHFGKYNEVIISISYFGKFEELTNFFISIVCTCIKGQRYRNNRKRFPSLMAQQEKKKSVPGKQVPVQVTSSIAVRNVDGEVREPSTSTSPVITPQFAPSTTTSTQNARFLVTCVECRKPRVLYSLHKLTERQKVSLVVSMRKLTRTEEEIQDCPFRLHCLQRRGKDTGTSMSLWKTITDTFMDATTFNSILYLV